MSKVWTLVRKEALDILRDKKTLIMMVVVPVLLYPLLMIGMTLVIGMVMQTQEETEHVLAVPSGYEALAEELETLYEKNREDIGVTMKLVTTDEIPAAQTADEVPAKQTTDEAPAAQYDACLEIASLTDGRLDIKIHYDSTSQEARDASEAAEDLLGLYREELLQEALAGEGLSEDFLHPVSYERVDCASVAESLGMDIGGSIGLMLMVTILLGAVYPSIDATAGERERGTLETLLTLPVTNFQMILSKFISVSLFACTTAVISLLSLGASVCFLVYGVASSVPGGPAGLSLATVLPALPMMLLTMITTALLATSLCMCFCIFARSFKEANNYITPVLLVVMFASMAAMIPSVKLDYRTALIPMMNVSLAVKQIISGQFSFALTGMVNLVNAGFSILVVWILAKLYDSEQILFADGFASVRIFQKRSEIRPGTVPAVGDLVLTMTVILLLSIYAGLAVSMRSVLGGTALTQLLILAVPLLVMWYMKTDIKRICSLRAPRAAAIPGSVLLYVGTYALVIVLGAALSYLLPESAQTVEESFDVLAKAPVLLLLFVTAALPGIGEELLFRGFLFGSLRRRFEERGNVKTGDVRARRALWLAILGSSAVFGLYHLSLVKFLTTALLGAAFAYITAMTGSIYVTMALHAFNNAMSMILLKYPDFTAKYLPVLMEEKIGPIQALLLCGAGALCVLAGGWLLGRAARNADTM